MKQSGNRGIRFFFRILLVCTSAFFLMSCLNWILEKPSFVLRQIILSPRSFTEMDLLLGLDIQNPNRFNLTLQSFECTMYLKNEEIGTGRLKGELLIPSSSTMRVQVPVEIKFKNPGGTLMAVITAGDLPYRIEGHAEFRTMLGRLHFPFLKEGNTNLGTR